MIRIRPSDKRGHADYGWLNTYHTFSFGEYQDPAHMQFRSLRVINEDRVAPGEGFGMHPHRNMEIVTYVLEGALEHRDSMGNGAILRPGEFQRMTAGTGINHSELNPSQTEIVHFYQIWLLPNQIGLAPSYEQKRFAAKDRENRFRLVASPDAADGSLRIHQDAKIFLASLDEKQTLSHRLENGRHAWLQILRGQISLGDKPLRAGDGAAISEEEAIQFFAQEDSEVMLFDLA